MSLTKLTENLNIIQALPDKPTIPATELKQQFDSSGNKIKTYINETLTEDLDTTLASMNTTIGKKASKDDVYTKQQTNALLQTKADSSDLSNLIKTEEIGFEVYSGVDPDHEDLTIAIGRGKYTIPTGYKVLTANIFEAGNTLMGFVMATIDHFEHDSVTGYDYVCVKVLGSAYGFNADIGVRMIYIKE